MTSHLDFIFFQFCVRFIKASHPTYQKVPSLVKFCKKEKAFPFGVGSTDRQEKRLKASVWRSDISPQREDQPGSVRQVCRGTKNRLVSVDAGAFRAEEQPTGD